MPRRSPEEADIATTAKKRTRVVEILLHPSEAVILIHYESAGKTAGTASRRAKWKTLTHEIPLSESNMDQNLSMTAVEIVENCPYLKSSEVPRIESLLREQYLRTHSAGISFTRSDHAGDVYSPWQHPHEQASIEELEDYIEALYEEELRLRVSGTAKIAPLFRDAQHLETLLLHESLVSALARLLHEDGKKHIELSTNIVSIFAQVSIYKELHSVLVENKIGSATMALLHHTLDHCFPSHTSRPSTARRALDTPLNLPKEVSRPSPQIERLITACLHLLLNLSQDTVLEAKMHQKGLVLLLVGLLEGARDESIVELCLLFLARLSIRKECIQQLQKSSILSCLSQHIGSMHSAVSQAAQQLTYNISFDADLRKAMNQQAFIPNVGGLLERQGQELLCLRTLYQLSLDDSHKSIFAYSRVLTALLEKFSELDETHLLPGKDLDRGGSCCGTTLVSLLINLAQNERNCEVMCEEPYFQSLIDKCRRTHHPLLYKIVRNISQHDTPTLRSKFIPCIGSLVESFTGKCVSEDARLEVAGCLANLSIQEVDSLKLLEEHHLVEYLEPILSDPSTEEDLLLEVIMWLTVLCRASTADRIFQSTLVDDLVGAMETKKHDPEIRLQICITLETFLQHEPTRTALTDRTQCVGNLISTWQGDEGELQSVSDRCLDLLMHNDETQRWREIIQERKFEAYNAEWIDRVSTLEDQFSDLGHCLRRRASSGLKRMIAEDGTSSDDDSPSFNG